MPKHTAKQLTEPGIGKLAKAKAGQRREVYDRLAPGLALRVTDRGTKTWAVHYRYAGKHQRITLNEWPALALEDARDEARKIRRWLKVGLDPKIALKVETASQYADAETQSGAGRTFGDLAETYIKHYLPGLANARQYGAVVRNRLIPAWGNLLISELRGHHLVELTDEIKDDEGSPMAAFRVYEVSKGIFTWALGRSERGVETNPFGHIKPPVKKIARQRTAKNHELKVIWSALECLGYPYGPWAHLLLLLGQRRSETAMIERKPGELDLDKAEWIIPAHKNKSTREHLVPLSPAAVAILRALPEFSDGKFVFTTTNGERPISGFGNAKTRADTAIEAALTDIDDIDEIEHWTWHDLRRTCSTNMAALGVPEIVRERTLNHVPQGLSKTYNIYDYANEKRDALERWALRLREITEPPPTNIVCLGATGGYG
ncbi:MAG: integrase arm-type DNA-binding domain-containing protein [Alphaproteobacteria bacterium]|nr:integrase arm-type DNA-binding domain-containing protein [Alphaproteobacteria bacterium]